MLLCDAAQEQGGKLYIIGGGWSIRSADVMSPMAVALKIEVPWDATNKPIQFELRLLTGDGEPVMAPGPAGPTPVAVGGEFEVGRPPGIKHGTSLDVPMALGFVGVPLVADQRYEFRLKIDDKEEEDWRVAFSTRPAGQ